MIVNHVIPSFRSNHNPSTISSLSRLFHLNRQEKALLPLPRTYLRPLNNRIHTTNPDPLGRSRALQTQHLVLAPLPPRGLQRIPDGEEDTTAHKQRRLADTPAALDRAQVLPLDVLEQRDVEHLRDIAEAGDLVGAGALGEEGAGGAVPEAFFRREEALALHEGSFDLAVVDGRVDAAANVHLDVRAPAGPIPR